MKQKPFYLLTLVVIIGVLSSLACSFSQGNEKSATGNSPEEASSTRQAVKNGQDAISKPSATPETVEETPTAKPAPNAYYEGISFNYDPKITKGVTAETIAASGPAGDDMPYFGVNPREYHFIFEGYQVEKHFHDPQIIIFKINEYKQLMDISGEENPVARILKQFNQLLTDRPSDSSGSLPFLPLWNAGQIFHAQYKYLDFQNGEGMRYVLEMGQAAAPAVNDLLFYTYQGMTKDKVYYVIAILPVTHPDLPASYEEAMKNQSNQNFYDDFNTYILNIREKLNGYSPDSFQPSLNDLDAMMESLKINP